MLTNWWVWKNKTLVKLLEDNELEEGALADKAKSGISVGTLRKVYNRGMVMENRSWAGLLHNSGAWQESMHLYLKRKW